MRSLSVLLLLNRDVFWEGLQARQFRFRHVANMIAFIFLASALYGAV
jgi:cytoplasmic iron level regulating protein YaaA (DUF328/UPF0246 family)